MDLHQFLRTYVFGLGHGRNSLESRRPAAPTYEVPGVRKIDLAGAFKKPADVLGLPSMKGASAVERSGTAGDYQTLRGIL